MKMTECSPLSAAFIADLETVFAAVCSEPAGDEPRAVEYPTDSELLAFGNILQVWRQRQRLALDGLLAELPEDDPLRCPVSLFGTMDLGRLETAHTRTLAWLLDHRSEHGFGSRLLESLLRHVAPSIDFSDWTAQLVYSEYPVSQAETDDRGRIDVLALGHWTESGRDAKWLLVIEAKVDAFEDEEQLARYDSWIEAAHPGKTVIRVFLSPDGRAAETGDDRWTPLSYLALACLFRKASRGLERTAGYHFLRYYLSGVLRDICGWPLPITADCPDPYGVAEYLQIVQSH